MGKQTGVISNGVKQYIIKKMKNPEVNAKEKEFFVLTEPSDTRVFKWILWIRGLEGQLKKYFFKKRRLILWEKLYFVLIQESKKLNKCRVNIDMINTNYVSLEVVAKCPSLI